MIAGFDPTFPFTPPGLTFEADHHLYHLDGAPMLSVTGVLRSAAIVDTMWFDEAARIRGVKVHEAIEDYHLRGSVSADPIVTPFLDAYLQFRAESGFRLDACEERLADPRLRCAGTLDLRGEFPANVTFAKLTGSRYRGSRIDVIDVKTGSTPPWVAYQTAGYVRLLPEAVRPRCRRWCLTLRADGSYVLLPLADPHDECVFLAALTIGHCKRGWL